jgi:eukaryotic-like serine/threonine-protein kinase
MGTVYAVTHRNRKRFALKMLHPELSVVEDVRLRFLREGYVANTVNHPGAVAVLDDDVAEDGSAFLVMELLEGQSFEALWEAYGRAIPCALLLPLFEQVLSVLAAAHAQGIVHRDIKPANLFLTTSGQVKVLDFGIARLRERDRKVTQTGAALGTPAFMAPEQARGETGQVTAQTDVWAVGATLFVLLTGRLVHQGATPEQLMINAATCPAPRLREAAPDTPEAVAGVVDRALAFEKLDRWSSASEMQRALSRACLEVGQTAAAVPSGVRPAPPGELTSPPTYGAVAHATRPLLAASPPRPRSLAPFAVALSVLLGISLAWWLGARSRSVAGTHALASAAGPAAPREPVAAPALTSAPPAPGVVSTSPPATTRKKVSSGPEPLPRARDVCARLLERQSLGEPMTPAERAVFNHQCQEAR